MQESQYHYVAGSILAFTGFIVLAYYVWCRRRVHRAPALHAVWLHCVLGAISFYIVQWTAQSSGGLPYWWQGWAYTLRAIPFGAAVATIALLVVRGLGSSYPKLVPWLVAAPWVFSVCWISAAIVAIVQPVPAMQYQSQVLPELLLLQARKVPELIYPALCTVVFFMEAFRRRQQYWALRAQQLFFLVASVSFLGIVILASFGTYAWLNSDPLSTQPLLATVHREGQAVALGVACIGFFGGLLLYHSNEEGWRWVEKLEYWIELRHELELAFDEMFGQHLVNGRGLGNSNPYVLDNTACLKNTPDNRYRMAVDHIRRTDTRSFSEYDEHKGEKLFLLFGLLRLSKDYDILLQRLYDTQSDLLQNNSVAWSVSVSTDSNYRYDIRNDAVFEAIKPALVISRGSTEYLPFARQPDWIQLAVFLAYDVGFLPQIQGGPYQPSPDTVEHKIWTSYHASP